LSRLDANAGKEVAARLEDEGRVKLQKRVAGDNCGAVLHLKRPWGLVAPEIHQLLADLAMGRRRWPLYLWGLEGRGKTRAALAICDRIEGGCYWTVNDVMDSFRRDDCPWHRWGVKLAVLDELGLPRSKEGSLFDYSVVKSFLDWREGRPAIYVSNLRPLPEGNKPHIGQLYCPRIASRLNSGTEFRLMGKDRRLA
jgi:hypothetical protein